MITRLLNKLPHRTIVNCDRQPYLTRWYLFRTKPLAIFLHRFWRSDEDRALHDHPWPFITFIIWRGYNEYIEHGGKCSSCYGSGTELEFHTWECSPCRGTGIDRTPVAHRRWPLTIHYRRAEHRHRVELIDGKPAWTLVFRFRERRVWGFWEKTGFVAWNRWWQNNCE